MSSTPLMIIDGYNVILNNTSIDDNDEESLRRAREELVRRLISRWSHKKIRVIVVFDGQPNTIGSTVHRPANFNIIFSRAPQQADDMILQLIQKETSPKSIILVTSDRKLADDGISCGVRHWPVEKLLSKIVPDTTTRHYSAKYDRPLSADEVEEWKKIFNLKEEDPS